MSRAHSRVGRHGFFFVQIVLALTVMAIVGPGLAHAAPPPSSLPWTETFRDEFTPKGLNTNVWTAGYPSDISGQCASPNRVSQPGDGYLHLSLQAETSFCGPPGEPTKLKRLATGGAIYSEGKYQYTYGYIEWHVNLPGVAEPGCPVGGCIKNWPAFWNFTTPVHDNELDVMEGLGGIACWHLHKWGPAPADAPGSAGHGFCTNGANGGGGWHTYGADWEPGIIKWYYDGVFVGQVPNGDGLQPSDISGLSQNLTAAYLEPNSSGGPFLLPAEALVDYVRVWQHHAPEVATNAASEVGQTTAKLNGYVDPNGLPTRYYFEYGKTTSYGSRIPADPGGDVGFGDSAVYTWNDIGGLDPGSTYHYRVVASNGTGTTIGNDQTFTTQAAPPTTTTDPATAVGLTSARLNGTVNPNGAGTSYQFVYGTSTEYGTGAPASPGELGAGTSPIGVSYDLTGLMPGTTYHYKLNGWNSLGLRDGADQTFTTLGPTYEVVPPGEVTQSKVTMVSRIDSKGYTPTYYFEYGRSPGYGSKTEEKPVPAGSGFQEVSAAVEGLPVGWTVHYRIVIKSSAGTAAGPDQVATTAWSNELSSGPAGAAKDWLNDVSCPAAGNCVAVGAYSAGGQTLVSAERWSGASWAPATPPAPAGASQLSGISCASTTSCMAVGYASPAANSARALIMKWNGSSWSEVSAGILPSGYQYYLNDVSCPTATSCEAVGYGVATATGLATTLALHWDGSAWTVRQSANPTTPGGQPAQETNILESVSCSGATFCKAVGSHLSSVGGATSSTPLIENLSASEWVGEAPSISNFTGSDWEFWLQGVSCPTTGACLAVGHLRHEGKTRAFSQQWNGIQWLNADVYQEANQATELYDVSCSSRTSCRAVGRDGRGLHWTGGGWELQAPKVPGDSASGDQPVFNGVACPTATECHAVGYYKNKSNVMQRLTQGWSGTGAVPRVSTSDTVFITETTAITRGGVDPAGVDANYYFEYGPTTAYGTKTPITLLGSFNAGPGGSLFEIGAQLSGLEIGQTYHYRVVATNGMTTVTGADKTFQTKNALAEMPVAEPFNGGSNVVSDFATKWAPLQWTPTRKGKNNANGYGPADTAANGAYFLAPAYDVGTGVAAQATIATGPGTGGRVSLWLDLMNPTTSKTGFELSMQETAANTYTLALKRWINGGEAQLATRAGFPLPAGSQVALFDEGSTVAAWANTGSGLVKVLSAASTNFSGGNAGVEVTGSTATRITNFKLGPKAEKAANFEAALKAVPLADELSRTESPLGSGWSALPWATSAVKAGKVVSGTGWTPTDNSLAGAYWLKQPASDTGTGDAVIATNNSNSYSFSPNYMGLWLNAPNPASARSGYELMAMGTGYNAYELLLYKWVNGTATLLGKKLEGFPLGLVGVKLALVDDGGAVSVWTNPGPGAGQGTPQIYTRALLVSDATYSYGYGGIEGTGSGWGLRDFRLGQLPPH